MKINKYTHSSFKKLTTDIISAGTSDDNIKIIKLNKNYNNPRFYPRKFKKWSDEFDINLNENNELVIRRSDVKVGGWGESLIIDVEFDADGFLDFVNDQKIPKVIYQTFETNDVPSGMYNSINSWINKNTDYEHYFFDHESRLEFIEKHFNKDVLDAYLRLLPGAFKADLWRCCVLYINGGVYVDADMICLKSLSELIEVNDEFLITRDDPMSKKFLANGFIASVPKHPFLKKMIDSIVDNVKNLKQRYYLDISGPGLFGKSVNDVCGRTEHDEFNLGVETINGYTFKVLLHDFKTKSFKYLDEQILITEYPDKINEMNGINNRTFYSMYQNGEVYQQIPRNIISTSEDTLGMNTYMVDSFTGKNMHWSFKHYLANDRVNFLKQNKNELFDLLGFDVLDFYINLEKGVEKADFFRYCAIYLLGGIYSDADTFCNIKLDDWIKHHDLILGIEAFIPLKIAESFGSDKIGFTFEDTSISVCNYVFAAKPKHEFLKNIILDIYNNPIKGNILLNTATGRMTKHAREYFDGADFLQLANNDIEKGSSVLFNINKFGSNQNHSSSYKNFKDPMDVKIDGVYIVHMFEGTWWNVKNKAINIFKSKLGTTHNLTIVKNENGYVGVSRLDKDTSRTRFMEKIGDCRSLVEYKLDNNFNITSELERNITNYDTIAKFEDYRFFTFNTKNYLSVSYVDEMFNTKVAILDDHYNFIGDIQIEDYNNVTWLGKTRVWEKNWLFFEKDGELFFIYSTTPNYVVYKCVDLNELKFIKYIDIPWPLENNVPEKDHYFTSHMGSSIRVATGGSSNPIFIKEKNVYLYFIHTKFYSERKYNHYAVILDSNLNPIKLVKEPIIKKFVPYGLLFVSSVVETDGYLVFTGGVEDNSNFTWELSKGHLFKLIGI